MMTEEAIRKSYQPDLAESIFVISHAENKQGIYLQFFKRALDVVLAVVGLMLSSPVIAIFTIAIILETTGPAFYKQERVGLMGRSFSVIKLRSMVKNAEKNGIQWAEKNDSRVTKVGAFIRKTRIDELPQLWNVIKGEMSIVGPRPERSHFTYQFNSEIPGFVNRLAVKPGLTGWAQINGGYDITPKQKLELDMHYIERLSLRMDLLIMLKTVRVIITGEGAR
ncbi:exopolysaccharide biosynthesis polyprenyl glycosylphosphotransferase [Paenibacillus glycanilyticus]|uniref:sugar transferase n=1 Tax=Paenibacillus glycanilyticus TaxID=126569 RepID=UPI00203BA766|nr:exopolysaccharide biosynthesis polyprenyl glycosylphosphotransferase [Paenibacillus glycanilyticus]MCM3630990.1 exopolysaccharide biosynthesis polyprenyl glycosylphosphotransferase [Paenibacillus glycanilyticus]